MKKLITLTVFALSLSWLGAQQDLRFGFQFSPTFSRLTTDNSQINANGTNLGLKLGMIAEYYFQQNYAFYTGLGFYFNAGGKLLYEPTLDTIRLWTEVDIPGRPDFYRNSPTFKYSIQYLEIPIGLKLRTREFGYLRYFFQPEIALNFRTQARGQLENVPGIDEAEKYDIKSAVNILNMSWGLGGGIEYSVSEGTSLIAGLAFQSGFADVTKDKNASFYRDGVPRDDKSKGKINNIILRLGVMF